MPLASARDLAPILGRLENGVAGDLTEAKTQGLVDSAQLGCTWGQCQRWFLTDACLRQSGLKGATWHDEAARCRLLEILPAVEGLYPVAGMVKSLGGFRQFQWLDAIGYEGPSCDAAVLYEEGWIALFWCGALLEERHLAGEAGPFAPGLPGVGGRFASTPGPVKSTWSRRTSGVGSWP